MTIDRDVYYTLTVEEITNSIHPPPVEELTD